MMTKPHRCCDGRNLDSRRRKLWDQDLFHRMIQQEQVVVSVPLLATRLFPLAEANAPGLAGPQPQKTSP